MLPECRLQLEARDVLAPTAQVVLLAVDEVEVAVLVELADIARMKPEVPHGPQGFHRTRPVAVEHHSGLQGSNDDLTGDARWELAVVVVDDPHVEVVVTPPRGEGWHVFSVDD